MPLNFASDRATTRLLLASLALVLAFLAMALSVTPGAEASPLYQGGPGEHLFQAKCTACHTIGHGKLVGPDLQGVTARRDAHWLQAFISDPNSVFASGDATAQQLLAQSNNVKMPALGLTSSEVDALIAYLRGYATAGGASATDSTSSQPAASAPVVIPPGDPVAGRSLFTGEAVFSSGGPACMGCHAVQGVAALGGGALGPDLTHVVQRYPGPGLAAVLSNIAFPTMAGPFANRPLTPQEQGDLVAFLTQADQNQPMQPPASAGAVTVNTWRWLAVGVVGTVALTVVLAFFWPRQRQGKAARLRGAYKAEQS